MAGGGAMVRPVQELPEVTSLMLRALDIVLPWGPQRMRPEALRLQEAEPAATPNDIAEAIRQVHTIEKRAYELTEPWWSEGAPGPTHEFAEVSREAAAVLADEFPFLPEGTITLLVSRAHYVHSM